MRIAADGKTGKGKGGAAVGSAGARPAPPDQNGVEREPPSTNRGFSTPVIEGAISEKEDLRFHLDYLKVTVFADLTETQALVESNLLEAKGASLENWQEKGPAGRWKSILYGPGPIILYSPATGPSGLTYSMVELKGEGCGYYGDGLLWGFLGALAASGLRWHGKRSDLAWDGVAFGPHLVDSTVRAGNLRSRAFGVEDRDWRDNEQGQTAYLGKVEDRKPRILRVYNKHGFNRCEAELRDEWADDVLRALLAVPVEDWSSKAVEFLRGIVDFVDASAATRIDRAPLLPWWAEFVQGAGRIRSKAPRERSADERILPIGHAELWMQRNGRGALRLIRALGLDWFAKRVEHYGKPRLTQADEDFIAALANFKHSGLGGTDTEDDPPF